MIVTNHSYSPFFLLCFQDEWNHYGRNPTCFRPLRQQQKAENETHSSSLPPPPSSPTSWVTFYQLWAWQVGEGRVQQEHWHRSLCMERFAFYSVCWWAHRCYSYRLQVIGKKKERECVCVHDRGRDWVRFHQCMLIGRAYSAKPHGTGSLVIFLQA